MPDRVSPQAQVSDPLPPDLRHARTNADADVDADSRIVLRHSGPVTQEVIVNHGRVLRALPGLDENARHQVFATFVELAQNIARYSAERAGPPGEERGTGTLLVIATPSTVFVSAANLLSADAAEKLAARLNALAPLDAPALKNLHRERRRAPPPPGSLGAGLGLIEIARRASGPLVHRAEPRPGGLVLFTLVVPLAVA